MDRETFLLSTVASKYIVADGFHIVIKEYDENLASWYLQYNFNSFDTCYLDIQRIEYIIEAIAENYGISCHSYFEWKHVKHQLLKAVEIMNRAKGL